MIPSRSPKESRVRQMGPSKSLHSALQPRTPKMELQASVLGARTVVAPNTEPPFPGPCWQRQA